MVPEVRLVLLVLLVRSSQSRLLRLLRLLVPPALPVPLGRLVL
jgi:hypothetical protein